MAPEVEKPSLPEKASLAPTTGAALVSADAVEAIAQLRPMLNSVRSGAWRVLVVGCSNSRERDAAAMFVPRLLDLADALNARR